MKPLPGLGAVEMRLDLPPELLVELAVRAGHEGKTIDRYVSETLEAFLTRVNTTVAPLTPSDPAYRAVSEAARIGSEQTQLLRDALKPS